MSKNILQHEILTFAAGTASDRVIISISFPFIFR